MKSDVNGNTHPSILIVEDEKDTLDILTTVIARRFPDVALRTATNGRIGLELFKTHLSDIVITDINMPDMTGVEMAAEIFAVQPGTKIIVLTGDTRKSTLEAAIGKGIAIDRYVEKPVRLKELFAIIDQCLSHVAQQ